MSRAEASYKDYCSGLELDNICECNPEEWVMNLWYDLQSSDPYRCGLCNEVEASYIYCWNGVRDHLQSKHEAEFLMGRLASV